MDRPPGTKKEGNVRVLTIDFETYWDSDYTLSKMTTEEYVRDPRFSAHMVGIKNGDGATVIVPGAQIPSVFARIPWHETAVVCQNTAFDSFIMNHVYGVTAAFYLDTLSMFRALYPAEAASLDNQTKVLGLPAKGGGFYNIVSTKGIQTLSPAEFTSCAEYCKLDCDLTWRIFGLLKKRIPVSELRLIDLTLRMFVTPILELEPELLKESWEDERQATLALFQKALPALAEEARRAVEDNDQEAWKRLKTPLSSNPQFANLLMALGVDPPKKLSPAAVKKGDVHPDSAGFPPEGLLPTTREIKAYEDLHGEPHPHKYWAYAFGKSVEEFKLMLQSDSPELVTLVEARLGVKSTIKETRAQRFMGIARRGTFPIHLLYYGAHTGRLSGSGGINPQNLNKFCPACSGEGCPKCGGTGVSALRRAIQAPEGHVIVVRDLSAIEARVNAWLSGQEDMVETFRRGEDIYCQMATSITGRQVTKADKSLRFLGKAVTLGCGYGLGFKKFQSMLRVGMLGDKGRILGYDIAEPLGVCIEAFLHRHAGYVQESLPPGVDLDTHILHCATAERIIQAFRDNKPMIPQMWKSCQEALGRIVRGEREWIGPRHVIKTCREGIELPNGMIIRYTELTEKREGRRSEYQILKSRKRCDKSKVYGGLILENCVQALSRIVLTDAMLKMHSEGMRVVHQVHDEVLVVAREQDAERTYERMGVLMAQPPKWAPDLPLKSEGGFGRQYTK